MIREVELARNVLLAESTTQKATPSASCDIGIYTLTV